MSKLPLALLVALALARCGPLCAQDQVTTEVELRGDASSEPADDLDIYKPRWRGGAHFRNEDSDSRGQRHYYEPCQNCDGTCDSGCDDCCDPDSPERRCFDGHRLRNAIHGLAALLPPAPPGTSTATDSWNRYPLSAGWFLGGADGSTIIDDWTGMSGGIFGGVRFGWDINSNMGVETRVAFGSLSLFDSDRAVQAQLAADAAAGVVPGSPQAHRFDGGREGDVFQCDVDVLLYPWGDARWRPYVLFGLGVTNLHFSDRLSESYSLTGFSMPLGLGVKYLWNDRLDLRFDLIDDIAFRNSGDFNTVNVVSFTGGIELRFGGSRQVYWPYDPDYKYW